MAVAIQGAVVLREETDSFTYQKKCEKCGALYGSPTTHVPISKNSSLTRDFKCNKCGSMQQMVIQG